MGNQIFVARTSSPGAEAAAREVRQLVGVVGGQIVEVVDGYGQPALAVELPDTGTCSICGEPAAHAVEDGNDDIVFIAEDISVQVGVLAGHSVKGSGRYLLLGEVSTCPGHTYLDPALVPLVSHPGTGEWVPGVTQRVGGRREDGTTFYADLDIPVGWSPAEAARVRWPECSVFPMGNATQLSSKEVSWQTVLSHGHYQRIEKQAEELERAFRAWQAKERGSMRWLRMAIRDLLSEFAARGELRDELRID